MSDEKERKGPKAKVESFIKEVIWKKLTVYFSINVPTGKAKLCFFYELILEDKGALKLFLCCLYFNAMLITCNSLLIAFTTKDM